MDEVCEFGTALKRTIAAFNEGCAHVVTLIGQDLGIDWISSSVTTLMGWDVDELVGRSAIDLVHPDDVDSLARLLAAEIAEPRPFGAANALGQQAMNRVRLLSRSGDYRTFEVADNNQLDNPLVNGMLLVLSDVTERRLLEVVYEALLAGESLVDVFDHIAMLLEWQVGGGSTVIELRHLDGTLTRHRYGSPLDGVEVRAVAGPVSVTMTVARQSASEWVSVLVERAAALARLTVQRQLGDAELRRSIVEQSALMSAVSHDLASPLAAITLLGSVLDEGVELMSTEQLRNVIRHLRRDARHMSRVLDDLSEADRSLRTSPNWKHDRVSIDAVIAAVVDDLDEPDRTIEIASRRTGAAVLGDVVLIERIVENLVANALKHTPTTSPITIGTTTIEGEVVVFVDDAGPGVAERDRRFIFDAYVSGGDQSAGTGMGLFLVKTFAEALGGRAWCEARPGRSGSRFAVSLPEYQAD